MGLGFGYVFGPLAKDIIGEMGWTRAEFSLTRVPQLAVMSIASPIIGTLTIRYGARPVLCASTVVLGGSFLLLSKMSGRYEFYALMMLVGLALTGVGDIAVGQAVSNWIRRGRGLALGLVYMGSNLGGVLLVPIAVATAEQTSWRDALQWLGLGALGVMLPVALLLVRDKPRQRHAAPPTAEPHAQPSAVVDLDSSIDVWHALRTRSFWILFFALLCFFSYFLALLEHLVLFLTDEGMDRSEAVTKYAAAIGLGIWSKLLLGLVADRIREKQALLIDYGVLMLSSVTLLALPDARGVWVFVVSFGFSYAARDVVFPLIVTRCFGLRHMAQIYGALMMTLVLGASGPYFAAEIHDRFGSYDLAFQIFAALNGLSLVALFFVRDERTLATATRTD
jgi:predicted MFS family arabinose efflux permease